MARRTLALVAALALVFAIGGTSATPAGTGTRNGMVATDQQYATEIGAAVLARGGNAVDAAVAVGYALAVTDPCCGNIGGGGFMLVRLADGRERFIDFRERAPSRLSRRGRIAYGTKPRRDLIQPAIDRARNG